MSFRNGLGNEARIVNLCQLFCGPRDIRRPFSLSSLITCPIRSLACATWLSLTLTNRKRILSPALLYSSTTPSPLESNVP